MAKGGNARSSGDVDGNAIGRDEGARWTAMIPLDGVDGRGVEGENGSRGGRGNNNDY